VFRYVLLIYCCLNIVVLALLNNVTALFILLISTYLALRKHKYSKYMELIIFSLLVFSIAVSNTLVDFLAYALSILPLFTAIMYNKIPKINVQYLLNIVCLIFLKLKIGYIVLPLAVYYFYKKYDSRIFIETSIVLLMTSAYLLNLSEDAANDVAIIAYYFLVLGVLGALIEYIRESKTEDYSEKDRINSKGI